MDELFYLIALAVGIAGGLAIWQFGRVRKQVAARTMHEQKENDDKNES
jgi:hypothetical protein